MSQVLLNCHILANLPKEYLPVQVNLDQDNNATTVPTTESIQEELQDFFEKHLQGPKPEDLAFSAENVRPAAGIKEATHTAPTQQLTNKRNETVAQNHYCNDRNGTPSNRPNYAGNNRRTTPIFQGHCNFCGIWGHKAANCCKRQALVEKGLLKPLTSRTY